MRCAALAFLLLLPATAWGQGIPLPGDPSPTWPNERTFAPPRNGSLWTEGRPKLPLSVVRAAFAAIKESAIVGMELSRSAANGDAAFEARQLRLLQRMQGARLVIVPSSAIAVTAELDGTVRISTGMINEVANRLERLPPAERAAFPARALGLVFAHEFAHLFEQRDVRNLDYVAVNILRRSRLAEVAGAEVPLSEAEVREALAVVQKPTGRSRLANGWNQLRHLLSYGTYGGRRRAILRRRWSPRLPGTIRTATPSRTFARAGAPTRGATGVLTGRVGRAVSRTTRPRRVR